MANLEQELGDPRLDASAVAHEASTYAGGEAPPTFSETVSRQDQIDLICNRFEDLWRSASPPQIDQFFSATAIATEQDVAARRILLEELIKLDMHYRWRRVGTASPAAGQIVGGQCLQNNHNPLPAQACLEHYAALFLELGRIEQISVALIAEEYRVRRRWGDRMASSEYFRRFPNHGQELADALGEIDKEFRAVESLLQIRIYADGRLVHSDSVSSPIELGRQQMDEPGPYASSPKTQGCRLIIASITEDSVSRQHARLELLADGRLEITNLSSSRSISFQDGGKLAAKNVGIVPLPALIRLGPRAIRVLQK